MQLFRKHHNPGFLFIQIALACLLLSLCFGFIGVLQYLFSDLFSKQLSFQKVRPLHVYLAISWILNAATGLVYSLIIDFNNKKLYFPKLAYTHAYLQIVIILSVIVLFLSGKFEGREYIEYPPQVAMFVIIGWILFIVNFYKTVSFKLSSAPVFIWSWVAGLCFFIITIIEAQLWLLPFFNNNTIRDVTIQWKALGSMVGAWNMLIYGSSMYIMTKMNKDTTFGKSTSAFLFFFLGLVNLMFNWGHHTYIVPASPVIKQVAYIISMTELILLTHIIFKWKKNYQLVHNDTTNIAYRFIAVADFWILLNLILAIAISIPSVNVYTHGTHITVAHAMGATIGINSMLLFAGISYILRDDFSIKNLKQIKVILTAANISLLVFWAALLLMGITKVKATLQQVAFINMLSNQKPYILLFAVAAFILACCLFTLSYFFLNTFRKIRQQKNRA